MKTISIIFICLLGSIVIYLYFLGVKSQAGHARGIVNGKLSHCPDTPNCVNSEYIDHSHHYISPLKNLHKGKTHRSAQALIKDIILQTGGRLAQQEKNYISATYTSSLFHFVDDLEVRFDNEKNIIHIRSASRVGHSDMGKNKKRVELIKAMFKKQQ